MKSHQNSILSVSLTLQTNSKSYYHYLLYCVANNTNELIKTLEEESGTAIALFKIYEMIVNLDRFQMIVVKRNFKMLNIHTLKIMNETSILKHNDKQLKIQEHALRILHNDYENTHSTLLNKSKRAIIEVKRPCLLALKSFQNFD